MSQFNLLETNKQTNNNDIFWTNCKIGHQHTVHAISHTNLSRVPPVISILIIILTIVPRKVMVGVTIWESKHVDILTTVYIYFLTFFLPLFLLGERDSDRQTYKIPFIVAMTVVGILAVLTAVVCVLYCRASTKKWVKVLKLFNDWTNKKKMD